MDLARSLGASNADPERPEPQWKLPEDEVPIQEDEAQSAWAAWNAAIVKDDGPVEQRDPSKETDFWRSAARDISAPIAEESGEEGQEEREVDNKESSTEIWRMARGVTGEMSTMQERLRIDLENFNPDENTDQYRGIARELVGPPDEPGDDVDPVRGSDDTVGGGAEDSGVDAEAGSGWNPDVDWMRFEDIRREQAKKVDADAREDVIREAQRKKAEALEQLGKDTGQGQGDITYTDENGRILSEDEVEQARKDGALFVDEAGTHISGSKESKQPGSRASGQVPGFIANKMMSRGTYGPGYAGVEEDIQSLQKDGVPLRDPKADAEQWLSAAKELKTKIGDDNIAASGDDILAGSSEVESEDTIEKVIHSSIDQGEQSFDESSSWSQWRDGAQRWEDAAANAEPRDPKAEVDMWRSSARELSGESQKRSTEGTNVEAQIESEDGNVWDSWRKANQSWQSAVDEADKASPESSTLGERQSASADSNSDWGAGLNNQAISERTAWQNWENKSGEGLQAGSSLWWPSSTNSAGAKDLAIRRSSDNNADQWRSAAIELGGYDSNPSAIDGSDKGEESRAEKMKDDSNLSFWKDIAKGLSQQDATSPEGNPGEGE